MKKSDNIIEQEKNTKIYYKGKLINYPFQTNIHELEKDEFIDCLYDLYYKNEKEEYDNFLDMLYGKFGKSIVEKFLKPYNEKLYACDLEKLDKDAMGRFFPYANFEDIINNMKKQQHSTYNDKFLYPKYGAQTFIDAIYNELDKENVWLNTSINKIEEKDKYVITSSNQKIYFDYLINTISLNNFLKLCSNDYYKRISNELSYNQVLVFNLGFEKKSEFKEHWIYVPDKNINFYRIGFYDNILSNDKLSMYIEIGFSKDEKIDVSKQLNETLKNLEKMGIIKDNKLKEYMYIIMNPAYVHINNKDSNVVNEIFADLHNNNIYSIGRYGGWTYCSMEDCMIEAYRLAEELKK